MTQLWFWSLVFVLNLIQPRLAVDIADYETFELVTYDTSIVRASVKIIKDFYRNASPTLTILRAAIRSNETYIHQSGLINEILVRCKTTDIVVNIEDFAERQGRAIRYCVLIFIDGYEAFR